MKNVPEKLRLKKLLGEQKIKVKKCSHQTKFGPEFFFGVKRIWSPRKCLSKKCYVKKCLADLKIKGFNEYFDPKILVQKNFRLKNLGPKKFSFQKFWSKQICD